VTRSLPRTDLLLGLACIGFAAIAYDQATRDPPAGMLPILSSPQASPPAEPSKAEPLAPFESFAEVTTRTLFSATRRPWQPPPAPIVAAAPVPPPPPAPPPPPVVVPPLPPMTLLGVVLAADGKSALLLLPNESKTRIVWEGAELGGWQVSEIGSEGLVLRHRAEARLLKFPTRDQAGSVPSPAPRPPTVTAVPVNTPPSRVKRP
jgi:hypothetical protein